MRHFQSSRKVFNTFIRKRKQMGVSSCEEYIFVGCGYVNLTTCEILSFLTTQAAWLITASCLAYGVRPCKRAALRLLGYLRAPPSPTSTVRNLYRARRTHHPADDFKTTD